MALSVFFVVLAVACSAESPAISPSPEPTGSPPVEQRYTTARVVNIVDGVTIDVEFGGRDYRVRYLGVQVPDEADGPLGRRALEFNRHRVNASGLVELETGAVEKDEYGNILRYVYVDGVMINMELLTNGLATVASSPPEFMHSTAFAIAEENARNARRGVWSPKPEEAGDRATPVPETVQSFSGGTLPSIPGLRGAGTICEYSGTALPAIKGNVESRTGERVYYTPSNVFYRTTVVSEEDGDQLFCTEGEALAAGWKKAKH